MRVIKASIVSSGSVMSLQLKPTTVCVTGNERAIQRGTDGGRLHPAASINMTECSPGASVRGAGAFGGLAARAAHGRVSDRKIAVRCLGVPSDQIEC